MPMIRELSDAELSTFGGQICDRRQAQRVSLAEFARRVSVSKAHLWQIEHGRVVPSVYLAARIARELGTTVDDLLDTGPPEYGVEIGA